MDPDSIRKAINFEEFIEKVRPIVEDVRLTVTRPCSSTRDFLITLSCTD